MPYHRLDLLLDYVAAEGRVCPMPAAWDELWRLLGEGAPPPLILAAWGSPWWAKGQRLRAQIAFAAEYGRLERVDSYLRRLPEDEWYCEDEVERRLDPEPLILRMLEKRPPFPARPTKGKQQLSLPFR